MKKSIFLKSATLLSSISLVICFLLFRADFFEASASKTSTPLQTSPNGGNITRQVIDSPKIKQDSTTPLMFASSKVGILLDKNPFYKDTLKKKKVKNPLVKDFPLIMSSSKSGAILDIKQQAAFSAILDSLLKQASDSLRNKIKKAQ